jgi:hypothetical protein
VTKKIILISNGNNNLNLLKHWFIKDLSKKYLVEIWNVDKIIGFGRVNKCSLNIKSRKIQTISKLKEELEKNNNNKLLFILAISYFYNTISVYYTLTKYSKFLVFFNWGYLPSPSSERSIIKRISNLYEILPNLKTFVEKFFKITIAKIIRAVLIKKYDLSFNAGSEAKKYNYAKKNFAIHLCDYDDFLESKNLKKKNFTVFLDIDLPNAIDTKILGLKKYEANYYYSSLNEFFDKFEKKFQTKIIIAGHPNTKKKHKFFNNRKIFYNKTAQLVKNCKYVVSHHSTSVSYAVLNYKPIIFIYNKQMNDTYEKKEIENFSKSLNRGNPFLIEDFNKEKMISIKKISKKAYNDFKYRYIVSKSAKNKISFKIIEEKINLFFSSKNN